MSPHFLFDASVPVFARYLRQLQGLLGKAAAHCEASRKRSYCR